MRPFFESSSSSHRAAAISVYGSLAKFATDDHRLLYLDQCHSILVPLLLHASSDHQVSGSVCRLQTIEGATLPLFQDTRTACLSTLSAMAGVAKHQPLIDILAQHSKTLEFG